MIEFVSAIFAFMILALFFVVLGIMLMVYPGATMIFLLFCFGVGWLSYIMNHNKKE